MKLFQNKEDMKKVNEKKINTKNNCANYEIISKINCNAPKGEYVILLWEEIKDKR